MPNWCYNNLDITAETEEQKAILERVSKSSKEDGFFEIFMPMPEILKDTTSPTPSNIDQVLLNTMLAQTGYSNWYDWRVANWGTKWDVEPLDIFFDGTTMSTSFDSAWAPPIQFYEFLVEQGFTVSASYYEPGMDFAGMWADGDDSYIENVSEVAREDEETWSETFVELNEIYGIADEVAMWDEDDEVLEDE